MTKTEKPKRKTRISKIALCTSAHFFKEAVEIERRLKRLGFKVSMPYTALIMKQTNNYDVGLYKTWFKNPGDYSRKAFLMRNHFRKVVSSDALLVVNLKKNEFDGYIGGNTLAEMVIGFYFRKPIFILNTPTDKLPYTEEILGMRPVFLEGDLTKIR